MQMTRRVAFLLVIIPFAGILVGVREFSRLPDGKTHVAMLDIGQGDSILITTPSGKRMLIDGGRDLLPLNELGNRLPFLDRTIDLLILSHPDMDHVASFPEILRRYDVKRALITAVAGDTPAYVEFLALLGEKKIPVLIADPTKDIDFGDGVWLDVIWPRPNLVGAHEENLNDTSVVVRMFIEADDGVHSILFAGDMEEIEENQALASGADMKSDILKAGHHGSKTSSSTGLLLAVDPHLALISVGRKNSYGHPSPSIIDRFAHFGIPVRSTAREGTVKLSF
jgi:competence protein ComEC